jgi:hypothetical protein
MRPAAFIREVDDLALSAQQQKPARELLRKPALS